LIVGAPIATRILDYLLGDLAVEKIEVLGKSVELPQVPFDCGTLVVRQFLPSEPASAQPTEQIGMRARRDEMRLQDGVHLVLDPGPMPNDLIAASHQSASALGGRIGYPDLRQEARSPQRCQYASVDLVRLDVSMGDRLHL